MSPKSQENVNLNFEIEIEPVRVKKQINHEEPSEIFVH